jgi:NADH-quinone oxidoreductase subunit L
MERSLLDLVGLAIAFPLLGAIVLGLFGRLIPKRAVSIIAPTSVFLSFVVGLTALLVYRSDSNLIGGQPYISYLFTWLHSGDLIIDMSFLVDPLSITMMLIVTGVSFLIHVYSIGYMAQDKDYTRFFCYLNLFVGAMLILVLGSNLPIMFIGWEGVGLCSYLLIGFWYERNSANIAGMKAFVVNRIGDFGVLIAIFLLFSQDAFRTLNFVDINRVAVAYGQTNYDSPVLIAICLFLFLGATGKSAQIPLYIWLPDAMEGPTPVSALIHAATMVTSGVYMLARLNVLFAFAPSAMLIVAVIGCATAFFAATIALSQVDIKRVLAYSTVSQLGYMFLACGVGAFWVGIFHLMTHAFFKALLFLGSGSVIHGMHEDQDIRNMGGLAKRMPATYWTFLAGTLAIAGVPFLSGFFSKDEILAMTFEYGTNYPAGKILYLVALITAGMTAFYMFRLLIRTFHGEPRTEKAKHAHESPKVMTVPLIILAILSVIGGYVALPHVISGPLGYSNPLESFLKPAVQAFEAKTTHVSSSHSTAAIEQVETIEGVKVVGEKTAQPEPEHEENETSLPAKLAWGLIFLSIGFAGYGIWMAFWYYRLVDWRLLPSLQKFILRFKVWNTLCLNKWYVDEIYKFLVIDPGKLLAQISWKFDQVVVDGIVNGTAGFFAYAGMCLRRIQTGFVRAYALSILFGAVLVALIVIFSRMVQ